MKKLLFALSVFFFALVVFVGSHSPIYSDPQSTPQIIVTPDRSVAHISTQLFGAVMSFQDNGQGALDPTKLNITGIGAFYPRYIQMVKDLGVTNLRWGDAGPTASVFEWQRSIGPQASRTMQRAGGRSQGTSSTYGPDEFAQLCEAIGATGTWVYNFQRGNAQDAANLLAYLTTPASAKPSLGPNDPSYWAAKRAANGHPAPYTSIRNFDIGNEAGHAGGWRVGRIVSVGRGVTPLPSDPKGLHALYMFGGTTAFTKQPVVGYSDLRATASISTGAPNQEFYASYPPVVRGTDALYVGNASDDKADVQWTRVGSLSAAGPTDKVYTLDATSGRITFGDEAHGAIPAKGLGVKLSYHSGPHDGYVQYYDALKKVDPKINIYIEDNGSTVKFSGGGATMIPGDSTYEYLRSGGYHTAGFTDHFTAFGARNYTKSGQYASGLEWLQLNQAAPFVQYDQLKAQQERIDARMGYHVPLTLTAWGHHESFIPPDDPEGLVREPEGLLEASMIMEYQKLGIKLADAFLLNDKPYYHAPPQALPESRQPKGTRWQAMVISNGVSRDFVMTPKGLGFQIMSKFAGMLQVASEVRYNPQIKLPSNPQIQTVEGLQTMAAKDSKGNVYLAVVNHDLTNAITAQVSADKFIHDNIAKVMTLNGPRLRSINRLDVPPEVKNTTKDVNVGSGDFTYTFPAHSVTRIDLARKR